VTSQVVPTQVVPTPPDPFDPEVIQVDVGHQLYRVHVNEFLANEFNPGKGSSTRFAFFGRGPVPILYGTDTEQAAICETILHEVPMAGGAVRPRDYETRVSNRIVVERPLKLASFLGTGLRRLRVEAAELTTTTAEHYGDTVRWAEAAHAAGFDGVVYMSKRCNSDRAYALFGDRVATDDLRIDSHYHRAFAELDDLAWLCDFCVPFGVDVLIL